MRRDREIYRSERDGWYIRTVETVSATDMIFPSSPRRPESESLKLLP